jgi:hypothetical protein
MKSGTRKQKKKVVVCQPVLRRKVTSVKKLMSDQLSRFLRWDKPGRAINGWCDESIVVRTFSRGLVVRFIAAKTDRSREETIRRHRMPMASRPEKVRAVIVSLKSIHKFVHLPLEEHDLMVTQPKKSFSILN